MNDDLLGFISDTETAPVPENVRGTPSWWRVFRPSDASRPAKTAYAVPLNVRAGLIRANSVDFEGTPRRIERRLESARDPKTYEGGHKRSTITFVTVGEDAVRKRMRMNEASKAYAEGTTLTHMGWGWTHDALTQVPPDPPAAPPKRGFSFSALLRKLLGK